MKEPNLPLNVDKARCLVGKKVRCLTLRGFQTKRALLALVDGDEELPAVAMNGGAILYPGELFEAGVMRVTWDRIEIHIDKVPKILGKQDLPPELMEKLDKAPEVPIEDLAIPRAVRNACEILGLHYKDLTPELIEDAWYIRNNPPIGIEPRSLPGGAPYINNAKDILLKWLEDGKPESSLSKRM